MSSPTSAELRHESVTVLEQSCRVVLTVKNYGSASVAHMPIGMAREVAILLLRAAEDAEKKAKT